MGKVEVGRCSLSQGAMGKVSSPRSHCFTHHPCPQRHPRGSFSPFLQMGDGAAQGQGIHSLVGGMAVTDHLSQDPLLIPIHSLYPCGHLVSRFGHVVPRSRNGPTEGWGPEGGIKC